MAERTSGRGCSRRAARLARVALACAVLAGACGAGCSGDGDARPGRGAGARAPTLRSCADRAAAEPVGITVWHAESGPRERALRELVADFERGNPTIAVTLEKIPGGSGVALSRWRAARPAERPSLALFGHQATRLLADSGQTVAPGRCLAEIAPDALPAITAAWSVDGMVRAVPFSVSTPVLVYDRRAFAAAGLDPDDPPATLDELREASQRLVDAGVVSAGLAIDTGPESGGSWFVEQWNAQVEEMSLVPANGRREPATSAAWRDGPASEHLAWLQGMVDDGLVVSVGSDSTGVADLVRLVDPEAPVAMALQTSASLVELTDALAAGAVDHVDIGAAPLPGPGRGSLPGGSGLWLTARKPDAETAAAWRLATFLASAPAQARWAAATGLVPIRRAAAAAEPLGATWAARPQLRVGYDALAEAPAGDAAIGMTAGPESEIHEAMAQAVDEAIAGRDPAAALADAADRTDDLLALYRRGVGVPARPG